MDDAGPTRERSALGGFAPPPAPPRAPPWWRNPHAGRGPFNEHLRRDAFFSHAD